MVFGHVVWDKGINAKLARIAMDYTYKNIWLKFKKISSTILNVVNEEKKQSKIVNDKSYVITSTNMITG